MECCMKLAINEYQKYLDDNNIQKEKKEEDVEEEEDRDNESVLPFVTVQDVAAAEDD